MAVEDKSGDAPETPKPEESKSVQELVDERVAETQPEGEPTGDSQDVAETDDDSAAGDAKPEGGDSDGDPPDSGGEPEPRQVPVSVLQKERQKRRDAQAAAKANEDRIAALEAQMKQSQTQQPKLERPHPDQFHTDVDYQRALEEYENKRIEAVADEKVNQRLQAQRQEQEKAELIRRQEKIKDKFANSIAKAEMEDETFEAKREYVDGLADDFAREGKYGFSRAIIESEHAVKVIAYLADNPDKAEGIATLSDTEQIKAIGAIEDKIKGPPPKPKNKTEAPKPVDPVGGSAKTGKGLQWKAGMSKSEKAEFEKQMKEQGLTLKDVLPT
jgi:3-methyladenine DNA glycosylase Tag